MKTRYYHSVSLIGFISLALLFVVYVLISARSLPEIVACHFNAAGDPDSWSSRGSFIGGFLATGLGLPIFIVGAFSLIRFFPSDLINLPNKEFWLSAENRDGTMRFLNGISLWMGAMLLVLFAYVYRQMILAHQLEKVHFSPSGFEYVLGGFVIGIAATIVVLMVHFFRKPN